MQSVLKRWLLTISSIAIGISLIAGCTFDLKTITNNNPTPQPVIQPSVQELPLAAISFEVTIPPGNPDDDVTLEILDEVTGLALNPQRYPMVDTPTGTYQAEILAPLGSVIKYRYLRGDTPFVVEYTSTGKQVRYRMISITGPSKVQDIVTGWTDFRYSGPTGRIKGQVFDPDTKSPFSNALVLAGGAQTLTASDGTFLLEGLPPGIHNLVVYSIDGSFQTFQQGALVAENSTTPAIINTRPIKLVNVTFIVQAPEGNIKGLPVRLVGNIYPLGNTFADLDGGLSVIAARAPLMSIIEDRIYSLTLRLPAGLDLRYKYSLGDGFWNAEHSSDGRFVTRQLIVPQEDFILTDVIETWQSSNQGAINFLVTVPENTPLEDTVSIQFNPYGWTAPIPMWPLGNNRWMYVLYSPLNMVANMGYRYCRNDQCGNADDIATMGHASTGYPFAIGQEPQTLQDEVKAWAWWNTSNQATTVLAPEVLERGKEFIAGIELSPNYDPTWQPYLFWGMNKIFLLGANWVAISPTWTFTRLVPPVFEPVTGSDPLWQDTVQAVQTANQTGLKPAIFPRIQDDSKIGTPWENEITEIAWWENWFERYQVFALHFADLASQTGAPMLILGGQEVIPALPGGVKPDGSPSGVPDFAEERWIAILDAVRNRYSGTLALAMPYPWHTPVPSTILEKIDAAYVMLSAPSVDVDTHNHEQLTASFGSLLDQEIYPLVEQANLKIIFAISYPSAEGASKNCVQAGSTCFDFELMNPPLSDNALFRVDLVSQVDVYNAALSAINERDWISGFISRGYYSPGAIQDASNSINGKPSSDVIWYWYPKLLGP